MTVDRLKEEIKVTVENDLLESMLFYTQEYRGVMPKREILKEFYTSFKTLL